MINALRRAVFWPRRITGEMHKRWRRVRSFYALKRLGIIAYFNGYPPDAIPPKYADLLGLYLITMQRRPSVILELGGGYSTFVFAHAVRELRSLKHDVTFYSVDESDHWQQVVKDHMSRELLPFIRFFRSNPKLIQLNGETVSVFDGLPVQAANLVYVDGGLVMGNNIGADAILLEHNAPMDYAIQVDNRKQTVAFLKRNLTKQYTISRGANGVQKLFRRTA